MLEDAIEGDVNVGGRDVRLLQRLVAKEGEARIALAGILWSDNSKGAAGQKQWKNLAAISGGRTHSAKEIFEKLKKHHL